MAGGSNHAIFINEDIAKLENRINVALMSVLMIPEFRGWVLGRLGLAPDSTFYPPQTQPSGLRPDLVAVGPSGDVRAWIEIETAGEQEAQMTSYRTAFQEPVKCIVGPEELAEASQLSLEELGRVLRESLTDVLDRQQRLNVQLFVDLVAAIRSKESSFSYATPGDEIRSLPFIQRLGVLLSERLQFGQPPVTAGHVQVTTGTQKAWTLRVHAKEPTYGSVSILWNPAATKDTLRVPSEERLTKYLAHDAVELYRRYLLDVAELDINGLAGGQSGAVTEADFLARPDALREVLQALAQAG